MPIVVTDGGQSHAIDCLDPATRASQVTTYYGSWGSGSTAPAVAQTALTAENAEARVACTVSQQTTQSSGDTIRYVWEVTASANRTAREFAVFTAPTAGTMIVRGTLASDTPIESGDKVEFTINVTAQNGASLGS